MASPSLQSSLPVNTGLLPDEFMGPRALPYSFALSANVAQSFDLYKEISQGQIDGIQAIWVDNQSNSAVLTITLDWQRLVIPIGAQGVFPVLSKNPQNISLLSTSTVSVALAFLNTPVPFCAWGP